MTIISEEFSFFADLASQLKDVPEDSIVSKTLVDNEAFKAVLFGFAEGQSLSEHTASKPAMIYFISGEFEVTLGEQAMTAQPCTWVHMEANLPHSLTATVPAQILLVLLK